MCRHIAYLGPPVSLQHLLIDQPHSLVQQSWAPKLQTNGIMNADGFGVGWYSSESGGARGDPQDPIPARYRRDLPIWADAGFVDLARVTRSPAVLAALRSGTPGLPFGESACAPFACAPFGQGPWLFSHNGAIEGYPRKASSLVASIEPERLLEMEAATDSALLWVLVRERLERGESLGDALADVAHLASRQCEGRFNFLLTDGITIAGITLGNSHFWRTTGGSVVVASEPYDDKPGWNSVPDNTVLIATTAGVEVSAL